MKKEIYSVFDKKLKTFDSPFAFDNSIMCRRFFEQLALSSEHLLGQYPNDFSIYCLGSYDTEVGLFTQDNPPYIVFECSDLVKK